MNDSTHIDFQMYSNRTWNLGGFCQILFGYIQLVVDAFKNMSPRLSSVCTYFSNSN